MLSPERNPGCERIDCITAKLGRKMSYPDLDSSLWVGIRERCSVLYLGMGKEIYHSYVLTGALKPSMQIEFYCQQFRKTLTNVPLRT